MKRIISAILCVMLVAACLVGCGKAKTDTIYGKTNLSKYVNLPKYEGIKVDTKSDEYKGYLETIKQSDAQTYDLFVKKEEGKVETGDIANIDYVGKKDGVAFEGGSAEGYDLQIGSGSFIPGFEDGLIGVEIGSTVDLDLTFPEDYGNEELAGAKVVFTVTVNSVKSSEIIATEEFYKDLGFKSAKEYEEDVERRAVQNYVFSTVLEKSTIKDYPKNAKAAGITFVNYYDLMLRQQYSMSLSEYMQQTGATLDDVMGQFDDEETYNSFVQGLGQYEDMASAMKEVMVSYAIFKNENLEIGEKTDEDISEYQRAYEESLLVTQAVVEHLYDSAKIK